MTHQNTPDALTKEEKALGAFLAAMHDCKLDGQEMRKAMLKVLGVGLTIRRLESQAEYAEQERDAARAEVEKLRQGGEAVAARRAYVPITDAELADPEYMRAYVEEMQATITDLITSQPLQADAPLLKDIAASLSRMFTAARAHVRGADDDEEVVGYTVRTGALHHIIGLLQGAGHTVIIPSNMPTAHETMSGVWLYNKEPDQSIQADACKVPQGLIDTLRHQRQVDEDGTECGVNRQAVDEAINILEALSAAPQPPAPTQVETQGWRPIETAPKDGTFILIRAAQYRAVACWLDDPELSCAPHWAMDDGHDYLRPLRVALSNPTHWMPIPGDSTPPIEPGKGES